MKGGLAVMASVLGLAAAQTGAAQNPILPASIAAGSAFTVRTQGSGRGTLYIMGLEQAIRREVQLGRAVTFAAGTLYDAGRYTVVLAGAGPSETEPLTVTPAAKPEHLSFLARPSRLPVDLRNGITGAVYVFDAYKNLITEPEEVSFELTSPDGQTQARTAPTSLGAAWTEMNSTAHQGNDKFVARIGSVSSTRIIAQVPGDPCSLKMTASPAGQDVRLQTAPVLDCSGNAVSDGTIVTFTEAYRGGESTVDVPIKRGFAQVEMPAHPGALISVASGVMMGNQVRWER